MYTAEVSYLCRVSECCSFAYNVCLYNRLHCKFLALRILSVSETTKPITVKNSVKTVKT